MIRSQYESNPKYGFVQHAVSTLYFSVLVPRSVFCGGYRQSLFFLSLFDGSFTNLGAI